MSVSPAAACLPACLQVRKSIIGFDVKELQADPATAWEAGFGSVYWMEGVITRLQDRHGGEEGGSLPFKCSCEAEGLALGIGSVYWRQIVIIRLQDRRGGEEGIPICGIAFGDSSSHWRLQGRQRAGHTIHAAPESAHIILAQSTTCQSHCRQRQAAVAHAHQQRPALRPGCCAGV